MRVDVHRMEHPRFVAQPAHGQQVTAQRRRQAQRTPRAVEPPSLARVVVEVGPEGLVEFVGRAGRLEHQMIRVHLGHLEAERRERLPDGGDIREARRELLHELAEREEAMELRRARILGGLHELLERRRMLNLQDQRHGDERVGGRGARVLRVGRRCARGGQRYRGRDENQRKTKKPAKQSSHTDDVQTAAQSVRSRMVVSTGN